MDQVLKESALEPEEILEREKEFFSRVMPSERERFSGLIYCNSAPYTGFMDFPAEGCDLLRVIITMSRPDMEPEEFRVEVREQLSNGSGDILEIGRLLVSW